MEKRMQKRSFVKILLLAAIALCTGLAILFAGLTTTTKVSGAEEQDPVATYVLGASGGINTSTRFYYSDIEEGWDAALTAAQRAHAQDHTSFVKIIFSKDWIANGDGRGFNSNTLYSDNYDEGRLLIPSDANIVIDLYSRTLNRNLTSGIENGQVIVVEGSLTITDSSATQAGAIKGGYNSSAPSYGGGIYVAEGAKLTLNAGSIQGNKASGANDIYGIGVAVDGGTFQMNGGTISGNVATGDTTNVYGGGVAVLGEGSFQMNGGTISGNTAVCGGGVASYNAGKNAITITRGTVTENKAVVPSTATSVKAIGGGICVYGSGSATVSGGTISKNTSAGYGAGVGVIGTDSDKPELTVSGGSIEYNVAVSLNSVYGGGVSVENGKLNVTNGYIQNNHAVGGNTQSANGGGVSLVSSGLALTGGTIRNNKALSLVAGAGEADIAGVCTALTKGTASDKVVNGTNTNGGGVFVNSASTFDMTGATVSANSAVKGGGVYADGTVAIGKAELDKKTNIYTYYGGSITNNSATYGGGLFPASNNVTVAGRATITNNTTLGATTANNVWLLSSTTLKTGKLTTGAKINVTLCGDLYDTTNGLTESVAFTSGYGDSNVQTVEVGNDITPLTTYTNPYNYFAVDPIYLTAASTAPSEPAGSGDQAAQAAETAQPVATALYLLVASSKEVNIVKNDVVFVVEDTAGTKTEYNLSRSRYITFTYGNEKAPAKISVKGVNGETKVENKAGVTTATSTEGASFSVVMFTRELSKDDVTVTLEADSIVYDGNESELLEAITTKHWSLVETEKDSGKYEYKLVTVELKEETDYTVEYARNKNVGTAIVTITFIGNYSGSVTTTFEITADPDAEETMTVSWEYYDGSEWKPFTSAADINTVFNFIPNHDDKDLNIDDEPYAGTNQGGKIRAILTVGEDGDKQAIYIENVANPDADVEHNPSMWLTFSGALGGKESNQFRNADTYTITLNGKANYPIVGVRAEYDAEHPNPLVVEGVKLNPKKIELTNADITDTKDNKLWTLVTGKDKEGEDITADLEDEASYSLKGETDTLLKEHSIAWYTGKLLYIKLNLGEVNADMPYATVLEIKHQLKGAAASTNGVVGINGAKNEIETTILLQLNGNFALYVNGEASSVTRTFINSKKEEETIVYKNAIEIKKTWYIVTRENTLYMDNGNEIDEGALSKGWTFGNLDGDLSGYAFRPEHGDTVIYSYFVLEGKEYEFVDRFALVYADYKMGAAKRFYNVAYDGKSADFNYPINDSQYLYTFNSNLRAGKYKVVVTVAEQEQNGSHTHWWDNDAPADPTKEGAVYYNSELTYEFEVKKLSLTGLSVGTTENSNIRYTLPDERRVEYNGEDVNLIDFRSITLNGITLTRGVDYELSAASHTVGWTTLIVEGKGSLDGKFEIRNAFRIEQATNSWEVVPSIISWSYNNYDKAFNLISGQPKFLDEGAELYFSISRDSEGKKIVSGLDRISLDPETKQVIYIDPVTKKKYDTRIATLLTNLPAGTYYLTGHVDLVERYEKVDKDDEKDDAEKVLIPPNYTGLTTTPIPFVVFVATNSWKETPAVESWTQGKFESIESHIRIASTFGEAHVKIFDSKDETKVYYDTDEDINKLAEAKAGSYTLKAWVDGDDNYSKLDEYTVTFQIFKKPGLPWWATMLVAVGALAAAALVIFILWKKGVFQILTEKIVVAIRTRASVEATIASVRAAKMMEEGRQSVADAKRRERIEQLRKKAQELRDMSPEERAAQLEAKAQAEAARAEKLRARSEANQAKAEKMRNKEAEVKAEAPETDAKKAKPEGGAKKAKEDSAPVEEPKKVNEESAPVEEGKETAEVSKDPEAPTEE